MYIQIQAHAKCLKTMCFKFSIFTLIYLLYHHILPHYLWASPLLQKKIKTKLNPVFVQLKQLQIPRGGDKQFLFILSLLSWRFPVRLVSSSVCHHDLWISEILPFLEGKYNSCLGTGTAVCIHSLALWKWPKFLKEKKESWFYSSSLWGRNKGEMWYF